MNNLITPAPVSPLRAHELQLAEQAMQPVSVPFSAYIASREHTLLTNEALPAYLLAPEVYFILDAILNDRHRLLFEFMFQSGARISEATTVRPKDLFFDSEHKGAYVLLNSAKTRIGRTQSAKSKTNVYREVPMPDDDFNLALLRHIKTNNIKKLSPIFDITRQVTNRALQNTLEKLGHDFGIKVTSHTFRHSFAINHLLHGQQIYDIKAWLGHRDLKATQIYTQVLGRDTYHLAKRTRFREARRPISEA